jgi:DNA (cytosine-5)-methyltransferase 1
LVELFAGIGGFSCGFDRVAETVAAVEIDPVARRIFSRHFPKATLFDDVTKVGGDDLRATGFVPQRGILTAGWPCTDISVAGRQAGIAGERSGLFSEVVRLLNELQPRWFVLENVPRLLSINSGRDMGTVVGALAECGYGFSYRVLDSSGFGVPQKRRRVFFVGHLGDDGSRCAEVLFDADSVRGPAEEDSESGPEDTGVPGVCDADGGWAAMKASTIQGGGKRGYRIDAEGVTGGHLLVCRQGGDLGVRRMTAVEWERLQGFPDGWTAGEADATRFRTLGNAVAVPVIEWIAKRLVQVSV